MHADQLCVIKQGKQRIANLGIRFSDTGYDDAGQAVDTHLALNVIGPLDIMVGEAFTSVAVLRRYYGRMTLRRDRLTELIVDAAISVASSHGVAAAARTLAELEIPLELTYRVLLQPSRRRRANFSSHQIHCGPYP